MTIGSPMVLLELLFKALSLLKMKLFGLRMFLVLKDGIGLEYPLNCLAKSLLILTPFLVLLEVIM